MYDFFMALSSQELEPPSNPGRFTLCEFAADHAFAQSLGADLPTRPFKGEHDPALDVQFQTLSLKDIDLGYAGRQRPAAAIHNAIGQVEPGEALHLEPDGGRYTIRNSAGELLGRCSRPSASKLTRRPVNRPVSSLATSKTQSRSTWRRSGASSGRSWCHA